MPTRFLFTALSRHLLFLVATMAALLLLALSCGTQKTDSAKTDTAADSTKTTAPTDSVVLEMTGVDSVSVFDLLCRTHKVDYTRTAIGVFVTRIDSQGGHNSAWTYTVNDTVPKIASDHMYTRTGDRIRWRLKSLER